MSPILHPSWVTSVNLYPTPDEQAAPPAAGSASAPGATCHGIELYHPYVDPTACGKMESGPDPGRHGQDRGSSRIVLGAHPSPALGPLAQLRVAGRIGERPSFSHTVTHELDRGRDLRMVFSSDVVADEHRAAANSVSLSERCMLA